jgi:hypothetical protein
MVRINQSATLTLEQFAVDKEAPELTLTPNSEANADGWYRNDVLMAAEARIRCRHMYSLALNENSAALDTVNPADRNQKYTRLEWQKAYDATGIYVIDAYATDNSGNVTPAESAVSFTLSLTRNTDSVGDRATGSINPYVGAWTNEDVTLEPSATNLAQVFPESSITMP